MQDAYVVDQQTAGTYSQIGFEPPTSTVFNYGANTQTNFSASATALTRCDGAQSWSVTVSVNSSTKQASFSATTTCGNLTPNFTLIGSSKAVGS